MNYILMLRIIQFETIRTSKDKQINELFQVIKEKGEFYIIELIT